MKLPKQSNNQIQVTLPFKMGQDVGLGDVVKRVTRAVGFKPCGGCEKRAAALNRRFVFKGRRIN